MEFKETNPSSPLKRDGRKLSRCPRLDMNVKTLDAVDQACMGDKAGKTRLVQLKIVISKKELKQLMAASNGKVKKGNMFQSDLLSQPSMEQLLNVLKRKVDANREGRRVKWRPGLKSIPEDI
ncbi:hypothetical protein LUZ60_016751 [Juncus effusus]|nr:hypothetical protein LUZ60_016751 [Juncus effusus]